MIVLIALVDIAQCGFEVIPVTGSLSDRTTKNLWPVFCNGAININSNELLIPDGTRIYIQERKSPYDHTQVELKRNSKDSFTTYELCSDKNVISYTVLAGDGRYYLFKRSRVNGAIYGPVPKHGLADRMILLPDGKVLASGIYRPRYVNYLDLYDDESQGYQTERSKDMFLSLYTTDKAFTLTIYDQSMTLIDSGNVLNRIGVDAQVFERFYVKHPMDVTDDNTVYLIDNSDGYLVKRYSDLNKLDYTFKISNDKFLAIPHNLNENDLTGLREQEGSYSVAYSLYKKGDYIITSFFQNPAMGGNVDPPYRYDISRTSGELCSSGALEYPIICEDDDNKIFLFVQIDGGWFSEDEIYLVGITIQDLLTNNVSKQDIDNSIAEFKEKLKGKS